MRQLMMAVLVMLSALAVNSADVFAQQTPPRKMAPKPSTKKPAPKKPSLRGSKAKAQHQNEQADAEKLTRLEDEKQLHRFVEAGILVPLPQNLFVRIDPRLEAQYRYCRPWTARFLNDLGKGHFQEFHKPIQINSAVRTLESQRELRRSNGNAAPISGPTASSHPTGSTIDLAKLTMSEAEINWTRDFLRSKAAAGQVEVAEEFRQHVFHVMVFKNYGTQATAKQPTTKKPPAKPAARRPK